MLISIINLNKSFHNKKILNSLNLQIPDKGIVLLKGENGVGKSTFLKIISKFIKYDNGEIKYSDPSFFDSSSFLLDIPIMLDSLTFEDNLMLVGKIIKMAKKEIIETMEYYQKLFGLPQNEYYGNFSLGMKKKAEISRTLMGNPKYIFWDEPFNSLDEKGIKIIVEEIIDTNKLFFIITHENILDNIANDIIYLP